MSKSEMMTRLKLHRKGFESFTRTHPLKRLSRGKWQIRLDKMDRNTRHMIETGRPILTTKSDGEEAGSHIVK